MTLIVEKYGGTSLADTNRIALVAKQISSQVLLGHQLIVVVSAMGDFTDKLLLMAQTFSASPEKRELDLLLSAGERISMSLLAVALRALDIEAISLTGSQCGILTSSDHGNARIAKITGERIRESLINHSVVIVAGFQGVHPATKNVTTLGRGGSDLTAVALAKVFNTKICRIFTDVKGVYNRDPRVFSTPTLIPTLGWSLMSLMASRGCEILHYRAAACAQTYKIPLEIRSSFDFEAEGTKIMDDRAIEGKNIEAVVIKKGLVCLNGGNELSQKLNQVNISSWLEQHPFFFAVEIEDLIKNSYPSFYLCTKDFYPELKTYLAQGLADSPEKRTFITRENMACISILGTNLAKLRSLVRSKAKTLQAADQTYIFSSESDFRIICPEEAVQEIVKVLEEA